MPKLTNMFKAISVPQYFKKGRASESTSTVEQGGQQAGQTPASGASHTASSPAPQVDHRARADEARRQRGRFSLNFGKKKKNPVQSGAFQPGGANSPAFQQKLAQLRNRTAPDAPGPSNTNGSETASVSGSEQSHSDPLARFSVSPFAGTDDEVTNDSETASVSGSEQSHDNTLAIVPVIPYADVDDEVASGRRSDIAGEDAAVIDEFLKNASASQDFTAEETAVIEDFLKNVETSTSHTPEETAVIEAFLNHVADSRDFTAEENAVIDRLLSTLSSVSDRSETSVSGEDLQRLFHEASGIETTTPVQSNEIAAAPPPGGERSQLSAPPERNGLRARLAQMFNTKSVPHPPAQRFEGDWKTAAAQEICRHWVDSQAAHNASTVSLVALSKMKALEYERKNQKDIPADQRLLSPPSKKQDYYEAEIMAFLETVGEKDPAAVLESFKRGGTGGLHRQHVVAAATVSNAVSTAGILVPDLTAKAVLAGVRVLLQAIVAERIADSGWRRLRNAGTEDMLPLGRADAAPSAKQAPNVFQASSAVISELKGAGKNLSRMEAALDGLNKARAAYAENPVAENRQALEEAKNKLEMAYAKACYQVSVKTAYKASSESAKIEFRGNQRQFGVSYAGTGLTVGASLLAILTPAVLAAPVTGGISAGAAAAAVALYVGYQLSPGPSKDGEAKAKRAIVALAKSMDLLSADGLASQGKRAAAYKDYVEERKAVRFSLPATKARVKQEATEKLLARLDQITQEEQGVQEPMNQRQNWEAYRAHKTAVSELDAAARAEGRPQEDVSAQIKQLEEQFNAAHGADFNPKNVADAWKTPMRMRMDSAGRLLKGKVAQSHKRLIDLTQSTALLKSGNVKNDKALKELKQELAKNLLDMFNLELALAHMKPLADGKDSDPDAMARAAEAIGAIQDKDVRSVFCGDAREQVEAVNKAKILTAGEAERYTYTNAGATAVSIGLNLSVAAVDLGLNAAKADNAVVVGLKSENPEGKVKIPKFNDYKFAALPQTGTQPAAHLAAGDRAAFQKREMQKLLNVTANDQDPVELRMELTGDGRTHLAKDDVEVAASVDALIARMWNMKSVPEKITLSMKPSPQQPQPPQPQQQPAAASAKDISLDMKTTSAYHRVRYNNAPLEKKLKSTATQVAVVARQAGMSVAGLPAQAIAQYSLSKTRAPLNRSAEMGQEIRQSLADARLDVQAETIPEDSSGMRRQRQAEE